MNELNEYNMVDFLHSIEEITYILITSLEGQNKNTLYEYFKYENDKDISARKRLDYIDFQDLDANKKTMIYYKS